MLRFASRGLGKLLPAPCSAYCCPQLPTILSLDLYHSTLGRGVRASESGSYVCLCSRRSKEPGVVGLVWSKMERQEMSKVWIRHCFIWKGQGAGWWGVQTHSLEQAGKKLDRHRSCRLQKPRAKPQGYRAGRRGGPSHVELSSRGWIQVTGARTGSGSNQEQYQVRPDTNMRS